MRPALEAGATVRGAEADLGSALVTSLGLPGIVKVFGLFGLVMAIAFSIVGWLVVRKTFAPIVTLNDPATLAQTAARSLPLFPPVPSTAPPCRRPPG